MAVNGSTVGTVPQYTEATEHAVRFLIDSALVELERGKSEEARQQLERNVLFCEIFYKNENLTRLAQGMRAGLSVLENGGSATQVRKAICQEIYDEFGFHDFMSLLRRLPNSRATQVLK